MRNKTSLHSTKRGGAKRRFSWIVMAKKNCKRCGERPAVIRFCNECAQEINYAHEHVMERAVAARAWFNREGYSNSTARRSEEVLAFIAIFHPEIPLQRAVVLATK